MIRRYGDGLSFARMFSPPLQVVCATNKERAFMGDAPTLALLSQTYASDQVNTWIIAHVMDLYKFVGVKEKPSFSQIKELVVMIRADYYFLKASELLLFFHLLKSGEFGTFYGVVDPMVVMSSLRKFREYRRQRLEQYERERQRVERERRWEEWRRKAVPCPDNFGLAKDYVERQKG